MANKSVIGGLPRGLSPDLSNFLRGLREQVQIQGGKGRGNKLDRAVTFRDIQKVTGSSSINFLGSIASNKSTGEVFGDEFPTAPSGIEVLPTFTSVLVKWDRIKNSWYSTTEIFRVTTLLNTDDPQNPYPYVDDGGVRSPQFGDAVQVASTISPYFTDDLPPGTTAVYWVRHINRDGQAGPVHATNGSWCTTKRTPLEVLEEYSTEVYQSEAYAWLRSEIGTVDALNRSMVGAGFNSSMANLLANKASVEDIMAEQALSAALDKHTQRFEIKAQFAKNFSRLSSGVHAAVNADEAYVQRLTTLESKWVNDLDTIISAKVTDYDSALTSPTGAIATKVTELETSFGTTFSGIAESLTTMALADSALAERSTALEALIDVDGESVSAQLGTLEQAIVDAETGAIATAIKNLSVSYGENQVSLQTLAETVATNDSSHARWGVKTDVNGKRGGVVFDNDGNMTSFLVDADVFAITNGAASLLPFIVKDSKTVIQTALIDHADIFTLIANNVTAKTIAATVSITTPEIAGGSITGTTLSLVGTGGKQMTVDAQGFLKAEGAEFKSITIKDDEDNVLLSSNGIAQTYIDTLFGVDATFKGTVYAQNLEGDVIDAVVKSTVSATATVSGAPLYSIAVTKLPFERIVLIDALEIVSTVTAYENGGRIILKLMQGDVEVDRAEVLYTGTVTDDGYLRQTHFVGPLSCALPKNTDANFTVTVANQEKNRPTHIGAGKVEHFATKTLARVFKQGSTIS